MSALHLHAAVVNYHRTSADIAEEHCLASQRINSRMNIWDAKIEPREIPADERAAAQARVDRNKSHTFAAAEASNEMNCID